MTRTYKADAAQLHRVYSCRDVQKLYRVSENTVSNWIRTGLRPVEGTRPALFRGAELCRYHKHKRARLKSRYTLTTCAADEFFCLGCKDIVRPLSETVILTPRPGSGEKTWANCSCPECGTRLRKLLNATGRDALLNGTAPKIQQDSPYEYKAASPLDIVTSAEPEIRWNPQNEIIIHEWQTVGERYDYKTLDAHLRTIRLFERLLGYKSFADIDHHDVSRFRNWLKERYQGTTDEPPLSKSTIRHMASYLRSFLTWLAKFEPKYAALAGLPEYLILPKALTGKDQTSKSRQFISLTQAKDLLERMPHETLVQRRDRAIFACAYTLGFRKNAITSLTLDHIDTRARIAHHDGRTLRAKNGKTFTSAWFPGTEPFGDMLAAWHSEMATLGATGKDALFPALDVIESPARLSDPDRKPVKPMASTHTIDAVFRAAGALIGLPLTPHSARDTLVAYGDSLPLNERQRKAWSQNLGHESETVTRRYYGKMTGDECIGELGTISTSPVLIEDDILQALAFEMHFYQNGTAAFEEAKRARARVEPVIARKLGME